MTTTSTEAMQARIDELEAQLAENTSTTRRLQIENDALREANRSAIAALNEANSQLAALQSRP